MNYPIRVLHVVVNMNRGGAETLIMNLYRNMDRTKVQFDFLTCKQGVFDAEILELGGRVHRIPYITEVGHFGYVKALDNFFTASWDYKIVHSHMDKMSGLVLLAAKKAGIPVRIAHSHSTKSEGGIAARAYKWYAGQYIPSNATNLMACSDRASKWLFGNISSKCLIVKNGIDLNKFTFCPNIRKKLRAELGINEHIYVVGHVGRFSHPKNHTFLIDIFKEYVSINFNSILVLAGDGPLRADIEYKVKDLGLVDRVKFLGVRSDVNCLLQAFDVFVFPSLYEGLPFTLIEAQGVGTPCIISDVISREVDMGVDLIEYLPLNDKMIWVKNLKASARRLTANLVMEALRKKGYDIELVSKRIKDFYLDASR
jgi:glycosyltransferase involved in cell wall biosynthesis